MKRIFAAFFATACCQYGAAIFAGPFTNHANFHAYELVTATTCSNAEAAARTAGGHLVSLNNAAENQWVFARFSVHPGNVPARLIGLTDAESPGTWKWANGTSVTYTHWSPDDPHNVSGSQYSACVCPPHGRAGGWDDTDKVQAGSLAITQFSNAPLVDVSFSTTFTNPRPDVTGFFGNSMTAVGSDKVLVTALFDGVAPPNAQDGLGYLFKTNGTLLRTFRNPQPDGRFFGHRVAALDNSHVLIASSPIFYQPNLESMVHLFDTDGHHLKTFRSPVRDSFDGFGSDIAAVGTDKVLIGAWAASVAGISNVGAAYLFSKGGRLLTTFTNPTPAADEYFGVSVAAMGKDRIVIGAFYDNTHGPYGGAAYVYDLAGQLLHTLTNPVPGNSTIFGYPVRPVGTDKVAIGAKGDNTGASAAGAVYLFSTNGSVLQIFTNPIPEVSAQFGYSLAGVGLDKLLIGGFEASRRAYLYRTDGMLLTTFTNSSPGSHWFGFSSAAVGSGQLMIGDIEAGTGGESYLFTLEEASDPARIAELVPCNGPYAGGVWKNHADYVMTLSRVARNFQKQGGLTKQQRTEIVKAGARSSCGKR